MSYVFYRFGLPMYNKFSLIGQITAIYRFACMFISRNFVRAGPGPSLGEAKSHGPEVRQDDAAAGNFEVLAR